ncbi:MAG: ester cyclase [Halioglobus sp.]
MNLLDQLYSNLGAVQRGDNTGVRQCVHEDVRWHVAHPVNDLAGSEQLINEFLQPLVSALPDIERKPFIHLTGEDSGQHWIDGTGYFTGTFSKPLFGIPATGKTLYLRYTEMVRIENDQIVEGYLILDFLDAMRQAGVYPLRAGLGSSELMMPPSTMDGIFDDYKTLSAEAGETSIRLVMDMLDCLRTYDGEHLESMKLADFWHPEFMWYGPGGIGTTRGISGFREQHQGPFLNAFPDRDVDHHANTIACGNYVATGGWPHMHGTHSGSGWLGLAPSNRQLSLRVMDIWRREDDLLRENWVAIDIPDMLMQMDIDVFAKMKTINTNR